MTVVYHTFLSISLRSSSSVLPPPPHGSLERALPRDPRACTARVLPAEWRSHPHHLRGRRARHARPRPGPMVGTLFGPIGAVLSYAASNPGRVIRGAPYLRPSPRKQVGEAACPVFVSFQVPFSLSLFVIRYRTDFPLLLFFTLNRSTPLRRTNTATLEGDPCRTYRTSHTFSRSLRLSSLRYPARIL